MRRPVAQSLRDWMLCSAVPVGPTGFVAQSLRDWMLYALPDGDVG